MSVCLESFKKIKKRRKAGEEEEEGGRSSLEKGGVGWGMLWGREKKKINDCVEHIAAVHLKGNTTSSIKQTRPETAADSSERAARISDRVSAPK